MKLFFESNSGSMKTIEDLINEATIPIHLASTARMFWRKAEWYRFGLSCASINAKNEIPLLESSKKLYDEAFIPYYKKTVLPAIHAVERYCDTYYVNDDWDTKRENQTTISLDEYRQNMPVFEVNMIYHMRDLVAQMATADEIERQAIELNLTDSIWDVD